MKEIPPPITAFLIKVRLMDEMKRGPGRPIGGKSSPDLRKYWREQQRKQRAKKKLKRSNGSETE